MKNLLSFILVLVVLFLLAPKTFAYNPQEKKNNIFGIHILFPSEVEKAAALINSGGGDWGYVTIPVQISDLDFEKWQKFMADAATNHVIPIVRLATEPLYNNTSVWRKPTFADVLDFANFLTSLNWPTKNRYIVVFNEVNRSDEWGGEPPNPREYAELLNYATELFKQRSLDFFIISAGLDNASPNDGIKYMDNFAYLSSMGNFMPQVFERIDGIASHSYPNPGFSQPPSNGPESTSTYRFELSTIKQFTNSEKPVFILETGWNSKLLGEDKVSSFLNQASELWRQDPKIIAVTPFLLNSENGSFDQFSFLKNGDLTKYAKIYSDLPKTKGEPLLAPLPAKQVLAARTFEKKFQYSTLAPIDPWSNILVKSYFKTILGLAR